MLVANLINPSYIIECFYFFVYRLFSKTIAKYILNNSLNNIYNVPQSCVCSVSTKILVNGCLLIMVMFIVTVLPVSKLYQNYVMRIG